MKLLALLDAYGHATTRLVDVVSMLVSFGGMAPVVVPFDRAWVR